MCYMQALLHRRKILDNDTFSQTYSVTVTIRVRDYFTKAKCLLCASKFQLEPPASNPTQTKGRHKLLAACLF